MSFGGTSASAGEETFISSEFASSCFFLLFKSSNWCLNDHVFCARGRGATSESDVGKYTTAGLSTPIRGVGGFMRGGLSGMFIAGLWGPKGDLGRVESGSERMPAGRDCSNVSDVADMGRLGG